MSLIGIVRFADAAQQTIDFTSTDIPFPPPSSITDSGFTFSVSGGYQRGFQKWYSYTSNAPGVMTSDTAPNSSLTITIRRTDNSTFVAVSLFVYNTDSRNATVQPRLGGSNVGTATTISPGSGQTITFGSLTVDQIRITGQTNATYSQMVLFDTLVYDVPNLPPVVANLSGDTATYLQAGPDVTLVQGTAATVTDSDSSDFAGGTVNVAITANEWASEDQLVVGNVGPITVSGSTVNHSGLAIGTKAGGTGGADLVVTLNSSATPARVQDLLRALQYNNSNTTQPDLGPRGIRVRVSDGDGTTPPDQNMTVKLVPTTPPGGTRTVSFAGINFGLPLPTTFTLDGFTFSVSGGFQRGFDDTFDSPVPPGVLVVDTSPGSNLTVTMGRFDGAAFDAHSLIVNNRDENTAMTVAGRLSGGTVTSFTVPTGATRRLAFGGATIDQIRITGQTSASLSQMGFFDELTFLIGNAPPEVFGLAGTTGTFVQDGPPVTLDQGTPATVTDTDSSDLNGGAVRAHVTVTAASTEDALDIGDIGPISVAGASVSHTDAGGVVIGTATGIDTGDLTIALTSDATPARVQDLVRALRYRDTSATPDLSKRTIEVTVDDGDGALPSTQTLYVKVLPPPLPPTVVNQPYDGLSLSPPVTSFDIGDHHHALSGGIQRTFQTTGDVPSGLGVQAGDTSPGQSLTVTITRSDSGDFQLHSLVVGNRDDSVNVSVSARNNGSAVSTQNLAPGRTRRLVFNGITVDEIRLTGQTGPVDSTALVFDDLAIIPPNNPPAITGLDGDALTWTEDVSGFALLDDGTDAVVADPDSTGWDGGSIVATITSGGGVDDLLAIAVGDGVTLSAGNTVGSVVAVDAVDIGSVSADGTAGSDLVIDLGPDASDAKLTTLVHHLAYSNTSQNPVGTRTIEVTVTDLLGGTSPTATLTVTLAATNDPPSAAIAGPQAVVEDQATALTGITISDPDAGATDVMVTIMVPRGSLSASSTADVAVGGDTLAMTLTGAAADVQTFLSAGSVMFTTEVDDLGDVALTVSVDDLGHLGAGGSQTAMAASNLTVTAVNDPPTLGLPTTLAVTEDQATAIGGMTLGDVDAGTQAVRLSLSVPRGSLAATSNGGVSVGGTATAVTLEGSLADLTTFLSAGNLAYTTAQDDVDDVTLTVDLDDLGHTGDGGPQTAGGFVTLTVDPVNDPPTVSVSAPPTVVEDQATALTSIQIGDVDAADSDVVLSLTVPRGSLSAAPSGPVVVGGTATALSLTGSVAAIQAAITGGELSYLTEDNDTGDVALDLSLDDQGASGVGGPYSTDLSVTITVDPVNDPPEVAIATGSSVVEDVPSPLTGITISDIDSGDLDVVVTLEVDRGTLAMASTTSVRVGGTPLQLTLTGPIIDVSATLATGGVNYTTESDDTGDIVLTVSIDDQGATGSGGPQTGSASTTVTVQPVNDPPELSLPSAQLTSTDTPLVLSVSGGNGVTIADVDALASPIEAVASVSNGTLTASPASGATISDNGTAMITVNGTLDEVNAALDGLVYTPGADFAGRDMLTVSVDDLGATGSGGPLADSGAIALTVDRPGPPEISSVAVTDAPGIELSPCVAVRSPARGFVVRFSEGMADPAGSVDPDDVTNPANYHLIAPGVNADLETAACGPMSGDDIAIPVAGVSHDPTTNTVVLDLSASLPPSRYRLLACGTTTLEDLVGEALDGDGDGDGGDDYLIDVRVDTGNLIVNGHTDCDLAGWTAQPATAGAVEWDAVDADGSSQSGAVHMVQQGAETSFSVAQCVPVSGDGGGTLVSEFRISDDSLGLFGYVQTCELFGGASCSGAVVNSGGSSLVQFGGTGGWVAASAVVPATAGVNSARCRFRFDVPGGGPFEGWIDGATYRESHPGAVFLDDFDDGTTDAWSAVVGN